MTGLAFGIKPIETRNNSTKVPSKDVKIIILPTDTGGATVIMNSADYHQKTQ